MNPKTTSLFKWIRVIKNIGIKKNEEITSLRNAPNKQKRKKETLMNQASDKIFS